jgi:dTDP-4-amino-4,6-dideoxygalactose transaminase
MSLDHRPASQPSTPVSEPRPDEPVQFLDIRRELEDLHAPLLAAMERVLTSARFILGPEVSAFEREAAQTLGVKHAVGVNSGTDALVIALRALGVGPGDEVITSPFTFISTAEAISLVGATPVFADILPGTFDLDPAAVRSLVTERTRAILPVHLYGQVVDMSSLNAIASEHELLVLEDAAQAFGANLDGKPAGALGHAATFSFYPTKNLGACGDGGLVTTDDDEVAERVRQLHGHGGVGRDTYVAVGYNSRLDELQAALLRVKLPHVERWNDRRRELAAAYDEAFSDLAGVLTPATREGARHVYHQYTVRIADGKRDAVREALTAAGVGSMVYYAKPLHLRPVYATGQSLPMSEQAAAEVLSLPIAQTLRDGEQERVVRALRAAVGA